MEVKEEHIQTAYEAARCRRYRGVDHETLCNEMFLAHELEQDQVDDVINEMLDRGIIYEPLLGHYKVV